MRRTLRSMIHIRASTGPVNDSAPYGAAGLTDNDRCRDRAACKGAGVIHTGLGMTAGVASACEDCGGKRFDASVLEHHLGGRHIREVLAMSEAEEFFGGR